MATNKHAQIRYNTLDKCFRNLGRHYTIDDLLLECNKAINEFDIQCEGINKRQLFEDIKFMKSEQGWNIDLEENLKHGRKKIYRYCDISFSISNQPMTESDASQLKLALVTLQRFKGLPQFEWIEELALRLNESFNLGDESRKIIGFDENIYLKGKEYISELYNAIHYKKVLQIEYKPFQSKESKSIILSPHYLKQYNNRWFLIAQSADYKSFTHIALDRVEAINYVDNNFVETDVDFEEYFDDVIGVTVPDTNCETIILKITNSLADYIKTKPLHGSQKIKEVNNEYSKIEISVKINYELKSLLLSFGSSLEVSAPEQLKEDIKKNLILLNKTYNI